jgi:competence protein ComEA
MFKKVIVAMAFSASTMLFAMSISEVNSASKEKLMEINGIGDKKADAIIKQRKSSKFKSFDDLQKVSGIGEKMVANIKNDVKSKTTKTSKKSTKTSTKSTKESKKDTKKSTKTTSTKKSTKKSKTDTKTKSTK